MPLSADFGEAFWKVIASTERRDDAALQLIRRMRRRPGNYPQVSYRCSADGCLLLEAYVTPGGLACRLGSVRFSLTESKKMMVGRHPDQWSVDQRTARLPERGVLLTQQELDAAVREAVDMPDEQPVLLVACRHQWGYMPVAEIATDATASGRGTTRRLYRPNVTA